MKKTILSLIALTAALNVSQAATLAFNSTTNPTAKAGSSYDFGVGHFFTVTTEITVRSLVFEGWTGESTADDLVTMQLWNASTSTVLATFAFNGSSTATAITYAHGSYAGVRHEGAIADVSLFAGTSYAIVAHSTTGIDYIGGVSVQTVGPEITFTQEKYGTVAGNLPTIIDGAAGVLGYGGPSFRYDVVPEPSSAVLLGLGGFALILRRRK